MFAEGLYGIGSIFILISLSRLIKTYSLAWCTSSIPEHKITLLMQCVESITDVLLLGISLIRNAMPISSFRIATKLYPNYA
jgi:uncharacterized membrane protein YqgA involved in biofilm formation